MYNIKNKKELSTAYGLLRCYKDSLGKEEFEYKDVAAELIKEVKAAIRAYHRKEDAALKARGRIVEDNGIDGYVALVELPDGLETLEEANAYFEENMYMEVRESQYDCTGQLFTSWYKVFQRSGRFMAYHRVSCDC